MSAIKQTLYKVETYIVPEVNKCIQFAINEIDDIKIANQFKAHDTSADIIESNVLDTENSSIVHDECAETVKYPVENYHYTPQLSKIEIVKSVLNEKENAVNGNFDNYDVKYKIDEEEQNLYCFDRRYDIHQPEFHASIISQDALYPARQFKRFNSLMSIDERSEGCETKLNDFCHHGYKNGCTATISSPEEVSEEIFQEHWLQKIEILRQKEDALRDKEINLLARERELFKREKEIRITERILKDKLRRVELQLERQRDMQRVGKKLEEAARILECRSSDESKETQEIAKAEKLKNEQVAVNLCERNKESEKKIRIATRTQSYSGSRQSSCNLTSRVTTYSNMKFKQRPKLQYDDMNSTLSADVGDSSFVRTSEKFNPEVYKKPYVFTRSASERWTKPKDHAVEAVPENIMDTEEKPQNILEVNKVLRRVSDNICASKDKHTKFQNYGLLDCKTNDIADSQNKMDHNGNEGKISYLDLETGNKLNRRKLSSGSKSRPISWNEETNEWLQKKREAYNLAMKSSIGNKENLKYNAIKNDRKTSKKDAKNKIFTIFR